MNIILASTSPRRQDLLKQFELPFTLREQKADESLITESDPQQKVKRLAELKAASIPVYDDEIVITADTIVSLDDKIFEKPKNIEDAKYMIQSLSGRCHQVYTAVVLQSSTKSEKILSKTDVYFYDLDDSEINDYVCSSEPYDKAGAYGIQSSGAKFVKKIDGDYNTIVGLPAAEVYRTIKSW
jgi:septum formation protein